MALECELKYFNVNLADARRRLSEAGGSTTGPYLESNWVLDYEDRSLKTAGILLRLREKQGRAILTVKKPPEVEVPSSLKVFEEIESVVDDLPMVKKALEVVGFKVAFAYEKVREKWKFMDCVICLDQLPFGDFVEIEGTEESVPACAEAIGLTSDKTTKATYHALNLAYREKNQLNHDESFVFSEDQRQAIMKEIGKDG